MDMGEPGDVTVGGMWEPIQYQFDNLPVHLALLHTGKVLGFGGSCNDPTYFIDCRPAEVWDPQTGAIEVIDQVLGGDIFCAGHTFLPDGRLLVAGGTYGYDVKRLGIVPLPPFSGLRQAYLFDPISQRWTRIDDMSVGRWYPSLIMLGNGEVLTMAGFTEHFPWVVLRRIEVYAPGSGWREFKEAARWMPLYPRLHLLPNGDVFYAGSYNTHYTFPFTLSSFPTATLNPTTGAWKTIGLPKQAEREEGSTVLLALTPPDYRARVLLMGGGLTTGTEATADAEIIDLSAETPAWESIASMHYARYYCYAVLLPDQTVLVVGGREGLKGHQHTPGSEPTDDHIHLADVLPPPPQDPKAVRAAEIFDPATGQWTHAAPMQVDRLYHSGALLLPDGRVMVTGSNPARGQADRRIEIYQPPYLFKGPRPVIESAPEAVNYGTAFEIVTPQAAEIDTVALIHPMSTTHCFSTEQRYVGLEITARQADRIQVSVPTNRSLLPPGYYMLFVLREGIPSVAPFVRVS
ncbi:MAG: DUF1929 domain-containing protein [Anaerolineae bacterium]|nr:DUF1929 domain-containing protein [Anaerolineae bacterium]